MKKLLVPVLFIILGQSCTGSGNRSSIYPEKMAAEESAQAGAEFDASTPDAAEPQSSKSADISPADRKIIKTGSLEMEVEKLKVARSGIKKLVENYGAEITSEQESNQYYRLENRLTIRILPEKFEDFIEACEQLSVNVQNKHIGTEDVTKQFVDLETRLQTKRDVIARYREILKSAKTVNDILAVEEKLRLVIEEVESVEAQLKYLKDQVGKSTLQLVLYETIEQPESDKRTFFDKVGKAFVSGWQVFLEIIVGLIRIWPVVLIIGVFFWWIFRVIRRRKNQNQG